MDSIKYRIKIQTPVFQDGRFVLSSDPIVIEENAANISVTKNVFSMGGISSITLYNLDEDISDSITYDRYNKFVGSVGQAISSGNVSQNKGILNNNNVYPKISIELQDENGGYFTALNGLVDKVLPPVRSGANLSTSIEVRDSGSALLIGKQDASSLIITEGLTLSQSLKSMSDSIQKLSLRVDFDFENSFSSADLSKAYSGEKISIPMSGRNIQQIIQNILVSYDIDKYTSLNSSILILDDKISFMLNTDQKMFLEDRYSKKKVNVSEWEINADNGLLQPPSRTESYVRLELIYSPEIKIGDKVIIDSSILSKYNSSNLFIDKNTNAQNSDLYVQTVQHSGTFNSPIGGSIVTIVQVFIGGQVFE